MIHLDYYRRYKSLR